MMTARRLLRHAAFLWMTLAGMATAQSFSEQVAGIYKTSPDFDFKVQLILWPSDEGFTGDAFVAGARYPVYAEQDGPALRGIFDVDGTLQRFAFLPSRSGHVAVQFSGEPVPISMTRAPMPEFAGHYSGSFGDLSLRQRGDEMLAEFTKEAGDVATATASRQGMRVSIPDLAISLYYEFDQSAYYIDTPNYFGVVQPDALPLRVGASETADFASLTEALEAAAPNNVIEIAPGTYEGPFHVTKPLTLRGSGKPEDIVLKGTGDAVLNWSAPQGRLSSLTIEGPEGGTGLMTSGQLSIEDARVNSSVGGIGLRLSDSANITVSKSMFRGGDHAVQAIDFKGALTLEKSELGRTEKSIVTAIGAAPESHFTIRENRFSHSPSNALRLDGAGQAIISSNEISDVRVALHHTGGQSVLVKENAIGGIGAHAIWFEGTHEDAIALNNNFFEDVEEACVLLNNLQFPQQGVVLRQNEMRSCQQFAVAVAGKDSTSSGSGLSMLGETLIGNGMHVALYAPVRVVVQETNMQHAGGAGLVVSAGVEIQLKSTSIEDSGENGLVAIGKGIDIQLDGSSVTGSGKSGIVLSGNLKARFDSTEISSNKSHGLELHQGVSVTHFEQNDVVSNTGAGVFVSGTVFANGKDNRIEGNKSGAILR
jgi:hypothetical protein